MKERKCLEFYYDSKIYNREEIEQNIEETKKEFPKQDIEVAVNLNQWGVYEITFYFNDKKKKKEELPEMLYIFEKPSKIKKVIYQEPKKYGQYKSTRTYRPY